MTAYQQQLRDKTDYLKKLFQGLEFPEIEVFESPEQHYRMRAEFRIWHEGGEMFYASQHFRQVLATEVSKTSVYAAQWNIEANRRDNIKIARLSAEEFTEAYTQSREFRRLQEQGISLKDYGFSAIFVDPPRAGVDEETLKLVSQFDNIIYISCNPETLRANLDTLCRTHTVKRAALFDQFPFTHHIESGVWLKKKNRLQKYDNVVGC